MVFVFVIARHIHFEPIVQMPSDYEHKTGEEEEEVMYAQRAKCYRFDDKQWKERGVGDVKLLRHTTTRKVRVLMRREQVLRTCLNHYVSEETELREMTGSKGCALMWHAHDFSEGEARHENVSLRFNSST